MTESIAKFLRKYTAAVSVVEKRPSIPVLATVLIDADKKTMAFTDMDILVTLKNVPISGSGRHCFPAYALGDILKRAKGNMRSLTVRDDALILEGTYKYTLTAQAKADDFPTIAGPELPTSLKTSLNVASFSGPAYAISTEETRYYLNGVYVHPKGGAIQTVATDGHRLCLHNTKVKATAEQSKFVGFIVPRKTVALLSTLLSDFTLEQRGLKARMTGDDIEIITKLIDGTFPQYERVIPAYKKAATIKTDWPALGDFCHKNRSPGAGLKITFEEQLLKLSIRLGADGGSVEMALKADDAGKLPEHLGFNASYIADIVDNLHEKNGTGHIVDMTSPFVVTSGNDVHVLMPMRV